jgi:hypothetical protein
MATDKTGLWSNGESVLWYSPTAGLDAYWSFGESVIRDEYTASSFTTAKIGGATVASGINVGGSPIADISKIGGTPK